MDCAWLITVTLDYPAIKLPYELVISLDVIIKYINADFITGTNYRDILKVNHIK